MLNDKSIKRELKRKYLFSFILLIFLSFPLFAVSELQGLVILGTDWGYEQGTEARQNALRKIISNAKEQNYNAIYFQVREAGESFYPSVNGSWSTLFNETDPGFDPLQFAINEAHRLGLHLYAQFDVLSAYSLVNRPKSTDHLYMKKGKIWIVADDSFNPISENATYFLDPSNPQVISYLKEQVNELVTNYSLDGIHFTHLYYPGNMITKTQAFIKQHQDIHTFSHLDMNAYAQAVLTSCLEALTTEIKLLKPYLLLSAETQPLLKDTKGIKNMEAADTYYMQTGIKWLEKGLIDVLVPRLHARSKSFNSLFNLYFNASELRDYIIPSLRGDIENYREIDLKKELEHVHKNEAKGAIIYSAEEALKGKMIFREKADLPYLARTHTASKVIELDLSQMNVPNDIVYTEHDAGFHFVDQYNNLTLVCTEIPRYMKLQTMQEKMRFQTREWVVPIRYDVVSINKVKRPDQFIELRKAPEFMTPDSSFAFLYKASVGDTRINGESIEAYSNTHIFFKEIAFKPLGQLTRIRGSVSSRNETIFYEDIYFGNMPDTTTKHAVVMESVSPRDTVILPPDDILRLTFTSMLTDEMDTILLYANGKPLPLYFNGKRYVGEVPCRMFASSAVVYLQVAARDIRGENYSYNLPLTLFIQDDYKFPVIESIVDFAQVSYSLGEVRLGGPYIQEYPKGVRFTTSGKFGKSYRVQLSKTDVGYIPENEVRVLPAGTPKPQFNITTMSIKPDTLADILSIPWPEPVPYTIVPQPEQDRIRITLYGVHSSSTWIAHREGLQVVDHISWEQRDSEIYDIYVHLKDSNIWGYDLEQNDKHLSFSVKYPPLRNNIRIAVEAGHGGEWNWGAVGLSGLKEKDVNRDTADKVRDMLIEMGYDVVEIRPEDTAPKLRERWLLTDSLDADIFISIHANAANGGYLRIAGTSTYYHNPFWRDYAELGYDKLRELDLKEFGTVGSFNYMMCRMTQRPSMLVEQAFMTHAEDENKLADPEFRTEIARKIAETINEYINDKLSR
ncbi:MAG: N-acetylmuramoyl-L-alanine amidase [Candidatus Marinimicrobia bacterium]|nr:N-acetylmuramoyl-L-alanine amidase [Candidatus Neomarinimicrobiota bacterium]